MKKTLSILLGLLCSSALYANVNVTIDVEGLSGPTDSNINYLYLNGIGKVFRGTQTYDLSDGTYALQAFGLSSTDAPYGTITVTGSTLTVTGALTNTPGTNVIKFDTTKLAKIEIDPTVLTTDLNGNQLVNGYIALTGANNVLRTKFFVHLPDGENYRITTRKGDLYGTFDILNANVSNVTGRLYSSANTIHLDRTKLLPVNMTYNEFSEPEGQLLLGVRELTNFSRSNNHIVYMPPGSHDVLTRAGGGSYGTLEIGEDLSLNVTGFLEARGVKPTTLESRIQEISIDKSRAPYIDIFWSELSEPLGLMATQITQFGFGVNTETSARYYLANAKANGIDDVTYALSLNDGGSPIKVLPYGNFTLSPSEATTASEGLIVEGNTLHFDTCALNKVTFSSAGDRTLIRMWHQNIYTDNTVSLFLPTDTTLYVEVQASTASDGTVLPRLASYVTVTDTGIVSTENFGDRLNITSQVGHCVPPDEDEDGIQDEIDECLNTAIGNKIDAFGCSVLQNIDLSCSAVKSKNHGRYVSCVSHVLNDLSDQGMITMDEKGSYMQDIAKK